jgi:hypothetical protein
MIFLKTDAVGRKARLHLGLGFRVSDLKSRRAFILPQLLALRSKVKGAKISTAMAYIGLKGSDFKACRQVDLSFNVHF